MTDISLQIGRDACALCLAAKQVGASAAATDKLNAGTAADEPGADDDDSDVTATSMHVAVARELTVTCACGFVGYTRRIALRCAALHCIALRCAALHCIALRCII